MSNIYRLTTPWLQELGTDDIIALRDHLEWIQSRLFNQYEPNWYASFDDRIGPWLQNVAQPSDQQALFRLLEHLFFIGKAQFDSLSRAAFSDDIARWVIGLEGLDLRAPDLTQRMNARVAKTWFCPITDSMRINSFLKLNNLRGHDYRPDWRSLKRFADFSRIHSFIAAQGIESVVLLEDFVGGGSQMKGVVEWAAANMPSLPILVLPLVCCQRGVDTGTALMSSYPNVTFATVLTIRDTLLVKRNPMPEEPAAFAEARRITLNEMHRFDEWVSEPFGYADVGALVTLFTNTPDNTLPAIFHSGKDWEPLFPRMRRG